MLAAWLGCSGSYLKYFALEWILSESSWLMDVSCIVVLHLLFVLMHCIVHQNMAVQ